MRNSSTVDLSRPRSVFISDVHLGFRGCHAEALCQFLRTVKPEYLFLVGDIIDLWSLKKTFFWPSTHTDALRAMLCKSREGTKVIYIPGNHDSLFRELAGSVFGNLEIHHEYNHTTANGKRFLVLHGDVFDSVVKCHPALVHLGTWLYDWLMWVNPWVNKVRRLFGFANFSLATALKGATGHARRYMQRFEEAAAESARRHGVDGIICGHIHHAGVREINGVTYANDGDWVEHCSSLVEDASGELRVVRWEELLLDQVPLAPVEPIIARAA